MTVCSKHIIFDLSSRSASDIIDSILQHWEVGRAKDLSAPRYCHLVQSWSLLLCWTQSQQQPPKCRHLLCRGESQTRTRGLGLRFRFHVKPVFPSLPLHYYLFLRRILTDHSGRILGTVHYYIVEKVKVLQLQLCHKDSGTVHVLSWSMGSVQSTYVFKHERELVNRVFMLYVFQVGLLNKLSLLWWCVTCTHTKHPQGPVHRLSHSAHCQDHICTPRYLAGKVWTLSFISTN